MQLRDEMNRAFQRLFNEPFFGGKADFTPAFNVEEQADRYVIEAELPGMEANDVDIELTENTLTIRGEKKRKTEKKEANRMHVVESQYGSFQRSFTLPENADVEGITAEHKNGVLFIHVPKDQEKKPRRIDIQHH